MTRGGFVSQCWLGAVFLVLLTANRAWAGTYANSAHAGSGTPANGLSRTATTAFVPGNCAHCHEQHASINGSEPAPTGGPDPYLGMDLEQNLCLDCHKGAGSVSDSVPTPDDINTNITKAYNHDPTLSNSLHRWDENFDNFTASPHVECTDCHNPHVARKGNHTAGSRYQTANGNLIDNNGTGPSPLEGVYGAAPDYSGATNWSAPTQASYTLQIAIKEYEICFKCHSGANPNYSSWGGAAAAAWADVGQEFNPSNKSFHPVVAALNSASSGSTALAAAQLINSWAPGDTMYCSDCHGSVSGIQGPHGSSSGKWMLAGTNQAWPYTSAAANGTSAGTLFTISNATTNQGTSNGLFCLNCHQVPTSANSNNVHRDAHHSARACVECHIRVPHGGKVSRLINANNNGAGALPARYFPNGNGGGTPVVIKFSKAANKDSYNKNNDCKATCSHNAGAEFW